MIRVTKSIRRIKVKLQETIKPKISNKSKNILGNDRVEQFMQRRNAEVSQSYHVIVIVTVRGASHFVTTVLHCSSRQMISYVHNLLYV